VATALWEVVEADVTEDATQDKEIGRDVDH
jgi:hypothetical protein